MEFLRCSVAPIVPFVLPFFCQLDKLQIESAKFILMMENHIAANLKSSCAVTLSRKCEVQNVWYVSPLT